MAGFMVLMCITMLWIQISFQQRKFQCGVPQVSNMTDLIVRGHDTSPGEWPWHVAIYHKKDRSNSYACGGTLISETFILTAAHCVVSKDNGYLLSKNRIFVRLGVYNLDALNANSLQQHSVDAIYKFADFSNKGLKSDIAILELSTVVPFNDYIQPACVSEEKDLTGRYGMTIGWGVTEDDETSPILKGSRMPVIDSVKCLESNRLLFGQTLDEGIFCAGYTNGTSVCNGDSGGGIFFKQGDAWYLGGIVSYSQSRPNSLLCSTDGYGAFTKIYTYLSWIQNITRLQIITTEARMTDDKSLPCKLPTSQDGLCVPIWRCRNINKILELATPPPERVASYIRDAACTLPDVNRSICCQMKEVVASSNVLPTDCGQSVNGRNVNSDVTPVFSYPWMALLLFILGDTSSEPVEACTGSLISKRYVLVAGHCLKNPRAKLHHVRLGEHTRLQDPDCNTYRDRNGVEIQQDCAGPVEDYNVESVVVHPEFDKRTKSNDIGLIRLDREVIMKDHIRPICLPVTDKLRSMELEKYIVTGWSSDDMSHRSETLQVAVVQRVDNAVCQEKLSSAGVTIQLPKSMMCAGGEGGSETCHGDSGAPLGFTVNHNGLRFVQFGLVSAGVGGCEFQTIPTIYTRVGAHMNWILEQLKP